MGSSYVIGSSGNVRIYLCVWVVCLHSCMCSPCFVHVAARRGYQISWKWNHGSLWTIMWVLGMEPGCSSRPSALDHWATSLTLTHSSIYFNYSFYFFRIQDNYIISPLSSFLPKPHLKLPSFSEASLFWKLTVPHSVVRCYSIAFYSVYKLQTCGPLLSSNIASRVSCVLK